LAKTLATTTDNVIALATLGDITKNQNNPIFCHATQEQWLLSLVAVADVTPRLHEQPKSVRFLLSDQKR
jgi:hypothetical protein